MTQQLDIETKFISELTITSDLQQIKQVLWNIFLNAYEAMPNGGLVRVTTDKIKEPNVKGKSTDLVKITVEDTGPGIESKVIKDMFKPFSTTKESGSGLGLAIVKKIIDSLNGKISGQNFSNRGAIITIILPFSINKISS